MYLKILLFIIVITQFSYSQTSNSVIDLNKAIEIAVDQNIAVLQSKNNLESQHSSYQSTVGGLLPSLGASGSFRRQQDWRPATGSTQRFIPGFGTIDIPGTSGFSAFNTYSTSVSTNITLFNGFANYASVARADNNIKFAEHSYARIKQNTIYQTYQLFLNLVRTYQLMKVNEENIKRSKRQLERIEETNKVGAAALADVYRQRTTTGNDELALINAQNNYEKAIADMALFLSLDEKVKHTFDFTDIPTEIDTAEFVQLDNQFQDIEELYKSALNNRSDYQSAQQNIYSTEATLTIAKAGYLPIVNASASYSLADDELRRLNDNKTLSLGLTFSLPIFSGFQTKNAIELAKISQRNAEDQLQQTGRQVSVDIQKAKLDMEAVKKQVKVTKESVFSAEMDRKIAEEKYNLGAGTLLDLLIANANYINAQSNKVNAVIGYLLAKKQMEYALGTISK